MPESPMSQPRLSIVIATFNAAGTLRRCLDSVLAQTFTDWEIVIADGASTDGTQDILASYGDRIGHWHSRPDGGIYDAWNQALSHARGEFVCFMGADDAWLEPRSLERLFSAPRALDADLISSQGLVWTAASQQRTRFGSVWDYDRLGRRMVVCHPGLVHRRTLFDTYGTFDTGYRIAGDLDFLLRLPRNLRTVHVAEDTILIEGEGISRRKTLARLREQRLILSRCDRYGPVRAYLAWLDKLWRLPVARLFGIPH